MKPEKLSDIKKELTYRSAEELVNICLRMAKYKKENKELLAYLLYDADNPIGYADQVKALLEADFRSMQQHYYYSTKNLRKIIRLLNKYARYTGSKQAEAELLLWFCNNYLEYVDLYTKHKPLRSLLTRQMEKIKKLLPGMEEDLQFDYEHEFSTFVLRAEKQVPWLEKGSICNK